jgi:Fic family protein
MDVDIDMYLQMHIAKEATQSSRIEGTQTQIEDAFKKQEDVSIERRDDWEELQNYMKAMNEAVNELSRLPFSGRLIRQTHKTLLDGVRGKHKLPGEFRTSQNWIGGATINDARFVPPPHTEIPELISDLEKFANNESYLIPDLIKIAIIHYQFETIHPFLDGNGRIGRLLITLYLVNKGVLTKPILYLSDFFERHRSLYYDNLTEVRTKNDMTHWLKFFLTGIIETANKGINTFTNIVNLQKSVNAKLTASLTSRADDAIRIVNEMYTTPVMDVLQISKLHNKSLASTYKMIADLERLGIIKEITGGQRGKIYAFKEYIDLF